MLKAPALPVLTILLLVVASKALAGGVRFEEVDLNGDGALGLVELQTAFGPDAAAILLADDVNGDFALSPEEILAKQARDGAEGTEADTAEEQAGPGQALHGQLRAAQAHATADARRTERAEGRESSEEPSRSSGGRGRGQQGRKSN